MRTMLGVLVFSASLFTVYAATRTSKADVAVSASPSIDELVEEVLEGDPRVSAKRATRYQLTGSVVNGERSAEGSLRGYRCEVSLILTERETGAVRAILSGRASGSGPRLDELEPKVTRYAVKSALRRLESLDLR